MYTDKINPDHPEGRLIISAKGFRLKDSSLPTSPIPLSKKADVLFKHLEDKCFEVQTKERMRKAYDAIIRAKAARNIGRYGKVLQELPEERKYLSWRLLYDYYNMLPDGRRVNCNAAYYRLTPYYQDLIDKCMTAGYMRPSHTKTAPSPTPSPPITRKTPTALSWAATSSSASSGTSAK